MGGPFIVDSIEEMKEIPIERMLKGCKCTVNEHDILGVPTPYDLYIKNYTPSMLSLVPGSDISDYWILDAPQQKEESAVEYQYSPNYNNSKPPFLSSVITKDAYNEGYGSTADYLSGDTGLKIWKSEFEAASDIWLRQRNGSIGDWGIPMKIDENYEEGSYSDIRFQWRDKLLDIPARPSSMIGGLPNNDPLNWVDAPDVPEGEIYADYIIDNNLWRISGIKDVYGNLMSEWSCYSQYRSYPS